MNKRDITILTLKLMSIYLFSQMLTKIDNLAFMFYQLMDKGFNYFDNNISVILIPLFTFILLGLFAAMLWFASSTLADRITVNMSSDELTIQLSILEASAIALSVAGVLIIIQALIHLFALFGTHFTMEDLLNREPFVNSLWRYNVLASIIRISFGLCLLFGSQPITRFIARLRQSPKPTMTEQNEE